MTRRGVWPWLVLAAGIVAVVVLTGPSGGGGRALDPTSTEPGGTKALVDAMRALGTRVEVGQAPPDADTDTALVLVDGLSEARRRALSAWMDAGGTLVVADRNSPLNPFRSARPTLVGLVDRDLSRHCSVPALAAVRRVRVPSAALLRARPPAVGCFTSGDGAWLVTEPHGRGNLVVLGGGQAFSNGALGDADNGLLAITLLAPREGSKALVVSLPAPGRGRRTLTDLISPHVWLAVLQLAVAFVLFALWRARRLGRPVLEALPVEIPGSELVAAVGRLLQRARGRDRAAALMRDGTRRSLAQRLGLPPGAPVDDVAVAAAERSGRDLEDVRSLLGGPPPASERELVELARQTESLSREVVGADE